MTQTECKGYTRCAKQIPILRTVSRSPSNSITASYVFVSLFATSRKKDAQEEIEDGIVALNELREGPTGGRSGAEAAVRSFLPQ